MGAESCYFLSKRVDVVPVEVSAPSSGLRVALLEKMKGSQECYRSSTFSNPSYSRTCPPPVVLLSSSNLDPCDPDTPYGPVGFQSGSRMAEGNGDDVRTSLQQLIFHSRTSGPVPVVLEYEKVQSQVSCSGSQVHVNSGQERCGRQVQTATVTSTAGPRKEAGEAPDKIDFQKLFGSTRILNEGSIQVCSGYERVQKLPAENTELHSLDSGVSSGVEEQVSQEDSLEDVESGPNHLLSPPPPPATPNSCCPPGNRQVFKYHLSDSAALNKVLHVDCPQRCSIAV